MRHYYRFFNIFAILVFGLLVIKEYIHYQHIQTLSKKILIVEEENFKNFINAFNEVYKTKLKQHYISLGKDMADSMSLIALYNVAEEYSKTNSSIKFRLISDRPRNPKNKANDEELKILKYFKQTKKPEYIVHKRDQFIYYKALYIQKSCLTCHSSIDKAPDFIKNRYNTAYGYKLGDLRGAIKVSIKNPKLIILLKKGFWQDCMMDFVLYLITIVIFWVLVRQIEKRELIHAHELLELNRQLRQEVKKTKELADVKSRFLANMSHEIRTPLNSIIGFVSLLKLENLSKTAKEYVEVIEKSSLELLDIINDILNFSKIEEGKMSVEKMPFNLTEEVRALAKMFEIKAKEKNIDFKVDVDEDLCIEGDATKIKQIIINLLSNAFKFSHNNSTVELSVHFDGSYVSIKVKDEGIGIPASKIKDIFKEFTQLDDSTTRKYGGTGLGLSIVSSLVKLLGGEITVNSQENKGSEFVVIIPAQKSQAVCNVEPADNLHQRFDYYVLLVEDNKANQKFMEVLFNKLGIKYDIANDGIEAFNLYKQNHDKYDMIFMDENMPNMTGIIATKNIRQYEQDNNLKHTFIIALTANALKGDKERFLAAGMDEYLSKPLKLEKLIEILNKFQSHS
ncbi:MAG: DUF3365 domain-containing protein [Epsilonproteobacteria bacterium]|nr:DUF3365 domain-containing protein [Campylobacterota bacterium]